MSSAFSLNPITLLYAICFLFIVFLTFFIAWKGHHHTRTRLRWMFYLLASSLLLWQLTLFLEVRTILPTWQLILGRINFAAVIFVAYFALRNCKNSTSGVLYAISVANPRS